MNLENTIYKCKKGDARAERALFDYTSNQLKAVAVRYLADAHGAEDVLQETYIRIFKNIQKFNYINDAATIGWMRQITATEAIRYLKRSKRWGKSDELKPKPQSFEMDVAFDDQLFKILLLLPSKQRLVFNMYAMEGYSHKEIANLLGIAESSSRSLLTRSRSFLKSQVAKMKRYELI